MHRYCYVPPSNLTISNLLFKGFFPFVDQVFGNDMNPTHCE